LVDGLKGIHKKILPTVHNLDLFCGATIHTPSNFQFLLYFGYQFVSYRSSFGGVFTCPVPEPVGYLRTDAARHCRNVVRRHPLLLDGAVGEHIGRGRSERVEHHPSHQPFTGLLPFPFVLVEQPEDEPAIEEGTITEIFVEVRFLRAELYLEGVNDIEEPVSTSFLADPSESIVTAPGSMIEI